MSARSANTPGARTTPRRKIRRSARNCPMPGAFTTCTATSGNGAPTRGIPITRTPRADGSARAKADSKDRVLRGGATTRPRQTCDVPFGIMPTPKRNGQIGFRCVKDTVGKAAGNGKDGKRFRGPEDRLQARNKLCRYTRGRRRGSEQRQTEGYAHPPFPEWPPVSFSKRCAGAANVLLRDEDNVNERIEVTVVADPEKKRNRALRMNHSILLAVACLSDAAGTPRRRLAAIPRPAAQRRLQRKRPARRLSQGRARHALAARRRRRLSAAPSSPAIG